MGTLLAAMLLALLVLGRSSVPAAAQGLEWQPVGFEGTRVHALAVSGDGRTLYVSTDVGLHFSDDGGESWYFVGQSLDEAGAPPVVSLAVHRTNPGVAYAGTEAGEGAGLYVTWDYGRHWQRIFAADSAGVSAIALDGDDRHLIFLAIRPEDGGSDELVMSWDGGPTWATIFSERGAQDHRIFEIETSRWSDLYVPNEQGILISHNGGGDWHRPSFPRAPVFSIALPPPLPGESQSPIYAASLSVLFESTDNGATWNRIRGTPLGNCSMYAQGSLAIAPQDEPVLFVATSALCPGQERARVFARSLDGDETVRWREVTAGLPDVRGIRLATAGYERELLFALTDDGLWKAQLTSQAASAEATATPSGQAPSARAVAVDQAPVIPTPAAPAPLPTPPRAPAGTREPGNTLAVAGLVALTGTGAGIAYNRLRRHRR